jgi:hypothetical protein
MLSLLVRNGDDVVVHDTLQGVAGAGVAFSFRPSPQPTVLAFIFAVLHVPCTSIIVPAIAVILLFVNVDASLSTCMPCWITSHCLRFCHTSYLGCSELVSFVLDLAWFDEDTLSLWHVYRLTQHSCHACYHKIGVTRAFPAASWPVFEVAPLLWLA